VTRDLSGKNEGSRAVWHRPRFEGGREVPLLLRDAAQYADRYTVDYRELFADTVKHLAAAVEAANDRNLSVNALAARHCLDEVLLKRWLDLLAVEPLTKGPPAADESRPYGPIIPLQKLGRKLEVRSTAIWGWGSDEPDTLPSVVANASDKAENIPGTVPPHRVAVHPAPTRFVAVSWSSPIDGAVRIEVEVAHAHPVCGNGIAWWLEHRRADKGTILDGSLLNVGQKADARPRKLKFAKGDELVLAVGARDLDHSCDLTTIDLTITETGPSGRVWNLCRDVSDTIAQGNPHVDRLGNKDVWRFVRGEEASGKRDADCRWPGARIESAARLDFGPLARSSLRPRPAKGTRRTCHEGEGCAGRQPARTRKESGSASL
jgi:hypothetical protein